MFGEIYKNKTVLVTGNTGFKGSWLTAWLLKLGANVVGISNGVPTVPSMFNNLDFKNKIKYLQKDIRNLNDILEIFSSFKPDFVFHLAAQPIVSLSYENPIETISSNVIGTTNVLEALRVLNNPCTAIMITSDKAYDNVEQVWGYKENDKMGGKDIYSGSKGAAELIIKSYYNSFFKLDKSNIKLAVGRAGNVIGGGDWAKDRIVVDSMLAWSKGQKVEIRSPKATRPWQHVLEPLSGYLCLGQLLYCSDEYNGMSFNFGPKAEQNHSVQKLLDDLGKFWKFDNKFKGYIITDDIPFYEAGLLKLNCDKALFFLKWEANLNYNQTISMTSKWYYDFYINKSNMIQVTNLQIDEYVTKAKDNNLKWTV